MLVFTQWQPGDQLKNNTLANWTYSVVFVFTLEKSIHVLTVFLNHCVRVKFPKLTRYVDNFPNPMEPCPCTKKDSDSPALLVHVVVR